MLIVWNKFQVNEGFEDHFEHRQRDGEREEVPGRLFVAMLRGDEPGVYLNMSGWESRDAYDAWRGSDSFRRAHSNPPPEGALAGRPQLTVTEVMHSDGILAPEHA
jgi:heme-degrading monooxygenase HmoA